MAQRTTRSQQQEAAWQALVSTTRTADDRVVSVDEETGEVWTVRDLACDICGGLPAYLGLNYHECDC